MPKMVISDDALGDLIPDGRYHVVITEGETRQTGDDTKFPGSDYWSTQVTVQDGPHAGRKDFVTIMLPPEDGGEGYKPYTLGNLLQAIGLSKDEIKAGPEVELYEEDLEDKKKGIALVGQELIMKVTSKTKNGQEYRNQNFSPYNEDEWDPEGDDSSGGLP